MSAAAPFKADGGGGGVVDLNGSELPAWLDRSVTNLSDVTSLLCPVKPTRPSGRQDIADVYRRQCELQGTELSRVCLLQLRDSRVRFCFYYPHDRAAVAFLRAVQHNPALIELSLKDNGFESEVKLRQLASLLENHGGIVKLNLSRNRLSSPAFHHLNSALMSGTSLVSLKLSRCGLADADGELLGRFLARDRHLEILDLSGNRLAGRTAAALADALGCNAYLLDLRLDWNLLDSADACSLAKGVENNRELRRLTLSRNGCADDGATAILQAARSSRIRVLDLSVCRVSQLSIKHLRRLLYYRRDLHALKLNGNLLTEEDLLQMLKAVEDSQESELALLEVNTVSRTPAVTSATPAFLRLTLRMEKEVKVKLVGVD